MNQVIISESSHNIHRAIVIIIRKSKSHEMILVSMIFVSIYE